ncbi:tyrosine-type recombinase/integrase [Thermodesulfobacteriota bacterium]
MKNPNHPKKGDRIAVDPIRKMEDVRSISKLLSENPRNHLLFTMGINNGLRVVDLVRLKVKHVRHLKPGQFVTIKESKTSKDNILMVNKTVYRSLRNYLDAMQPGDDEYLFKSRKGTEPLQPQAVSKLMQHRRL